MVVSPPRPKGPPLNALRAFEAAARCGSFIAAADELCVTPGAIAQHVKALEAWAGEQLFVRRAKGVELSALGRSVLPDFTGAFDDLGAAVQRLRSEASPYQIRIAALPSIAQLWLSPRLPHIRKAVPDVTISITALEHPPNLKREPFDVSLFFEHGVNGEKVVNLGGGSIFPVCAPILAEQLMEPSDLAGMTFLHDQFWREDWDCWIGAAAPELHLNIDGPAFSLYSLAVEEAKNGAGVLMGHEALVAAHLGSGELVAPFAFRLDTTRRLCLVAPERDSANPAVQEVTRFLLSAAL